MQIKVTIRFHLTPIRMATIKKKKKQWKIASVYEDVKKLESLCIIGRNENADAMENSMLVSQKIKSKMTMWTSNSIYQYRHKRTEK